MRKDIISINYENIRKNYDDALISTARGFNNIYDFLDYWVPDEDELKSIITLLHIAKDEKIKALELDISSKIKSMIDIETLEREISLFGKIIKHSLKNDLSSYYLIEFESE